MPLVYYNRQWRLCKSLYSPRESVLFWAWIRKKAGGTYFTEYDGADGAAPSRMHSHRPLGRADARPSCGIKSLSIGTNGENFTEKCQKNSICRLQFIYLILYYKTRALAGVRVSLKRQP